MLKFLQIASIVCEKAKKNEKIREYFPCLLWRARPSIQICSLLLALLSIGLAITYITTGVPNFAQGSFALFCSLTVLLKLRAEIRSHLLFRCAVVRDAFL